MKKILIVEDEEFLSRALADNLELEGCSVDIARDGEDAMAHIKKNRPDVVLLDLLMPKKDGFFVIEEVKNDPELRSIPIIVLSNLGGDEDIKKAISLGADDYFVKSQHPVQEVVDKAKDYLEGRKSVGMK